MKNLSFTRSLLALVFFLLAVFGFYLLPTSKDIKIQAQDSVRRDFLSDFHKAETLEDGQILPDARLMSREGREVSLAHLVKGRVTVINLWASWCAPCLEELPSLARFQENAPDVLVLPVSFDMQKTLPDLAKIFKSEELSHLRWFYDQQGVLRKSLSLQVYPTTYILDSKGRILYKLQGPVDWSSKKAAAFARTLTSG